MKKMLKIEIKRAFANKWFLISVVVGCIITLLQVIFDVIPMTNFMESSIQRGMPPHTVYNKWIAVNPTIWNTIFFTIFPLLSAIPYANSFHIDLNSGYIKNVLIRTRRTHYLISKFVAVFVSSGAAVLIPLCFNLYLCAMVLPVITPSASAGFYPILETSAFSALYYAYPMVYVLVYLAIIFLTSGILSSTALVFSYFIKYKYVISLVPDLVYIFISFQSMFFAIPSMRIEYWVNPCNNAILNGAIVIFESTIILFASLLIYLFKGRKDDVF